MILALLPDMSRLVVLPCVRIGLGRCLRGAEQRAAEIVLNSLVRRAGASVAVERDRERITRTALVIDIPRQGTNAGHRASFGEDASRGVAKSLAERSVDPRDGEVVVQ